MFLSNNQRWLAKHREVNRVGNEAKTVRLIMKLSRQIRISAGRNFDDRPERNLGEVPTAVYRFYHLTFGVVLILDDNDAGLGAEM
jgi:hypothetical protein